MHSKPTKAELDDLREWYGYTQKHSPHARTGLKLFKYLDALEQKLKDVKKANDDLVQRLEALVGDEAFGLICTSLNRDRYRCIYCNKSQVGHASTFIHLDDCPVALAREAVERAKEE